MHGFGLYTGIRSTVKWPANRYSVMYNHTSRLCSPEVQNVSCVIGVTHTSPHWPSPHSRHSSVRSHWTPRAPHPIISCLLQKLAHICSLWQLLPQDFDRANWFLATTSADVPLTLLYRHSQQTLSIELFDKKTRCERERYTDWCPWERYTEFDWPITETRDS